MQRRRVPRARCLSRLPKRVKVQPLEPRRRAQAVTQDLGTRADCSLFEVPSEPVLMRNLHSVAKALWANDYGPLLDADAAALRAMGLLQAAGELKEKAPRSSYDQQRRRKEVRLPIWARQQLANMEQLGAVAARQANQQIYPIRICARSIAALSRRMDTKDWNERAQQKELLSRNTTVKLVRLMMANKPELKFKEMPGMSFWIYDQCYKRKGASRGKHRAAEKVDASGQLIDLISMVIINSIQMPIPELLAGGFAPAELNYLSTTGPYCKPFSNVLRVLNTDVVKASTFELMKETGDWLSQVHDLTYATHTPHTPGISHA